MENTTLIHLFCYLLGVHIILSYGCGQSEYRSEAGDCCPMCNLGMVVQKECDGDYSTACELCSTGRTYMDQPNGLKQCFPCKSCHRQKGLYVLSSCTVMRNTQCKVMEGYYCTEFSGGECSSALKHRQCEPGEAIKTPGSEKSDTVCEACPSGFYSPLGIKCTRWTDCSVRDEVQQRAGSAVEDVQCVSKSSRQRYSIIPAAASALILLLLLIIRFIKHKNPEKSHKKRREVNRGDERLWINGSCTGNSSAHTESSVVRLNFFRNGNRETRSAQP
ncbi:tumor necrosis factor receptor superfamily member 14-like isoform X2 [Astyanax mexicanus]|uniref:tumor necrosis factor receptor superfamily member 14-like isoform X2 n=1 Tax=Astyanax mexicanus TaxID=7994 RepID=UPI0020CB37F4|nr:tumor necrosis factor receptor superfamily member 14-like isoform X2 [Astyanax mexicanus]